MEPIVQNHKQRSLEMKTIYFLLCIGLLFTSCSSVLISTQFTGTQATNENEGIKRWNAGWIHYTSYPIQYHESGKWIYLISSFDSVHSPY